MLFSESIERALRAAFIAHEGQLRKGSDLPYITHPVHVAMLVARAGGDDVAVQSALLHDVVEDCDGWTKSRVAEEFGDEVASVVDALTEIKGRPWEERKGAALARVPGMCVRSLAVKAADKIHNMRSLTSQIEAAATPEDAWESFSRGPKVTIDATERVVEAVTARLTELDAFESLREDLADAFRALARHRPKDAG